MQFPFAFLLRRRALTYVSLRHPQRPSVKLSRRIIVAPPAVGSQRSGGLSVFAVSEPSTQLGRGTFGVGCKVVPLNKDRRPKSLQQGVVTLRPHPRHLPCASERTASARRSHVSGHMLMFSAMFMPPACFPLRSPIRPPSTAGSNTDAHAGYGIGLCPLQGQRATEPCLTRQSTGHPTAGHNGALRLGRAAVGCRLPLR